jgi:serine protease Do
MNVWKSGFLSIVFSSLLLASSWTFAQTKSSVVQANVGVSDALEIAASRVSPAVVQIFATSYIPGDGVVAHTADLVTAQRASGSGVIVDGDGYIVTNAHVVRGAQRLRVELPVRPTGQSILATSSRTVNARILGIDLETDLAVIKVDEKNLPSLSFGNSDELRIGQLVLAIGSPLGLYNSVSLGVVSAVARQLEPESPMIYVQTDASINPGSSGGPLVDLQGHVVGIDTFIVSQAGGNEGLGFAAPSNIVRSVYEQIRKTGRVRRGDIGVRTQTVTPELASGLNLPRDYGVVVSDALPGSPAERVGLRPGDMVLTIDGKPVENGRQFQIRLYPRLVGDVVELGILRDGQTLAVPVAMTERRDSFEGLIASLDPHDNVVPALSILGVSLNPQIAEGLPALRVRSGVLVASTVANAIDARDGGLAAGDIIFAVNRKPVRGLAELRAMLEALKAGDPVVLQLERHGVLMFLAFTME